MEYEINKGTLAIMPNENESSLVYEDEDRFLIEQSPFQIIVSILEVLMKVEKKVLDLF